MKFVMEKLKKDTADNYFYGLDSMDGKTNIQVSRDTRNELAMMGKKGDTYDDIIRMLIRHFKEDE